MSYQELELNGSGFASIADGSQAGLNMGLSDFMVEVVMEYKASSYQRIVDKWDGSIGIYAICWEDEKLNLNIALYYSGTYDITQAVNRILAEKKYKEVTEDIFTQYLLSYPSPNPDLFIRTSGEVRISNFMLWQLAYSECYFTETLWPDVDKSVLDLAIQCFNTRERRFGMISEQL